MLIRIFHRGLALLAVYALLIGAREAWSYDVRVTWLPVSDAGGYRLYVRENGGEYGAPTDLGALPPEGDGKVRYIASGLDESVTHTFALSSYDAAETAESPLSNELSIGYADVIGLLDSDGDGLLDALEDRDHDNVVDPGETDRRRADTDGDGYPDGQEVASGTDPLDPNDPPAPACDAATLIPAAGGTFTDTTAGTGTLAGSCAVSATSPEKVFRWVPASSGIATFDTCSSTGTSYDTVLYVRRTNCSNGTQVVCADDTTGCSTSEPNDHHGSRAQATVTAGQTYFIVVDGSQSSGQFSLHVVPPPLPTVVAPTPTTTPQPTATSTATATPQPTATRTATATPLPTVTRTATATPLPTVTRTATTTPMPTATRTPSATVTAPPTEMSTVTPSLTATVAETTLPTPTESVAATPTVTSSPLPTPSGACTDPTPIPPEGGILTGTNASLRASSLSGSCAPTNRASESVFEWTPSESGVATMRAYPAFGTRFDTVLYVRGSSCFDGLEVACNDNRYGRRTTASGRSGGSRLEVNVNAGETYYVVVDGAYGSTGRFTLVINPPVPTAGTTATDPDTGPTPSDTPLDPDAGDPPSDEHPVAQRCQRVTDSTGDSRPPLEIHTVDRFGDTTAVVQDALRLCTPIETSPSTSDDPSVIRFDITIREHLPTSLADAVHVANELGEMILDVLEPASVQTAAVIDTAPPESIAAAVEAPLATCYKVRASDGSADSWTLDVTLDDPPQQVTLIGPTRLCTTEHPVDDDAAAEVHLCYRMRTAIPDSATVWVTSTLGSDRVDLGATDEICLPSTIVDEPN